MAKYEVKNRQSLFDVAVEVYGDASGVVWLCEDNPQLPGPTGPVSAGEVLEIRDDKINTRVVGYLAVHAPFSTITERELPQGIGFWRVEDYVVG